MTDIEIHEREPEREPKEHEQEPEHREEIIRKGKKPIGERLHDFFSNPKKRLIFIICLGLLLIAIFGTGMYLLTRETPTVTTEEKKVVSEETKYEAVLDGVMTTDKDAAEKHPLGIIVENHPDARPQAGLEQASIVYEAIAEGGITRFLALYGTNEAEKVGPVRSARTYYVDWANGYDAYLAHVGGNIDALDKIAAEKILDLDQFRYPSSYWREKTSGVASEHTMFTSTLKLRGQAQKLNYSTANNFTVYNFTDDPVDKTVLPDTQKVSVNFSSSSSSQYDVAFNYDKTTNSYKRTLAGKNHVDKVSGNQLSPKNIVVMTVQRKPTITRINESGYIMTTVGSGVAKFYINGVETVGTWKKNTKEDREIFYDSSGSEITFGRGQLWICVMSPDGSATAS